MRANYSHRKTHQRAGQIEEHRGFQVVATGVEPKSQATFRAMKREPYAAQERPDPGQLPSPGKLGCVLRKWYHSHVDEVSFKSLF
jgi:hypothetical protein